MLGHQFPRQTDILCCFSHVLQHPLSPLLSHHIPLCTVGKRNSFFFLSFIQFSIVLSFCFGSNEKELSPGVYIYFKCKKCVSLLLWSMIQTTIIVYCVTITLYYEEK